MGQESSLPTVDESTPTQTLESRTLESVAKSLKEGRFRRIVVMTGAGISTSAGIPDFRSPDTGLYANLARLNLPYPEAVFDISYFRNNPLPFYTLAQELYPGKYRPTITHSFIRLLYEKGLLLKLFTQNIDCLEREAGVPGGIIVEAHGSFARQNCINCHSTYPDDLMHKAIRDKEVPHCLDEGCGGLVKPEIVFFGEQLPADFFHNRGLPAAADLCIIMGTSLSVHPFAGLPQYCSDGVPRLLINQEQVGTIGSRSDDVLLLGDCDYGVRRLATSCGWLEELEELWKQTAPTKDAEPEEKPKKSKDEQLEDEVEKLTKEVEETLKLSENQHKWLETHVDRKIVQIKKETAQGELHEATGEPAENQEIQESNPIKQDSDEILRPVTEAEEKSNPEPNKTDSGGDGLQHIFPHLAEKLSL